MKSAIPFASQPRFRGCPCGYDRFFYVKYFNCSLLLREVNLLRVSLTLPTAERTHLPRWHIQFQNHLSFLQSPFIIFVCRLVAQVYIDRGQVVPELIAVWNVCLHIMGSPSMVSNAAFPSRTKKAK